MASIRPSPIAGSWYPRQAERLAQSVDQFLAQAQIAIPQGRIIGLVAPHAGHTYSGSVAAHGFRCVEGLKPDHIAIISPLHMMHPGQVLTSAHDAYSTPLGQVEIDARLVEIFERELLQHGSLRLERIARDPEHAIEIELPFLQRIFHHAFTLLPIMLRDQSPRTTRAVGQALSGALSGRQALLIASSDLSHFYPDPIARKFDDEMLARLEAFDPQAVLAAEEEGAGFACGRGAIAAVLSAAQLLGADEVQVLRYANSGDVTGDRSSVVGYASAVIYQRRPE
jgi:MEMO1 family protein